MIYFIGLVVLIYSCWKVYSLQKTKVVCLWCGKLNKVPYSKLELEHPIPYGVSPWKCENCRVGIWRSYLEEIRKEEEIVI